MPGRTVCHERAKRLAKMFISAAVGVDWRRGDFKRRQRMTLGPPSQRLERGGKRPSSGIRPEAWARLGRSCRSIAVRRRHSQAGTLRYGDTDLKARLGCRADAGAGLGSSAACGGERREDR